MKNQDIISILLACEDLKDLTEEEIRVLASIGKKEVYRKGEEIFTIHHKGENFYIVLEGRLLLRLKTNQSKEYKMGELFGEVAILGDTYRFGTICATEESMILSFNRNEIFNSLVISKNLALKVVLSLSKKIVSYFDNQVSPSSQKLIAKGESDFVEFKESISPFLKESILKSMVGFMNLNGGVIFCGVEDKSGQVVGIKSTVKEIDDFMKLLSREIKNKIGISFVKNISFDIEEVSGVKVLRIDCKSASSPVFYREYDTSGNEKEFFIVRSGSENVPIKKTSEIIKYVQNRYKI